MKPLKITLMLAVFCLTISGTTQKSELTPLNDTIQKIDNNEFKFISEVTKNTRPPKQRA